MNRFRTKADRDAFLKKEMTSMDAYQGTRTDALEATREELETNKQSLNEVQVRIEGAHESIDDGKRRVKDLAEQLVALKDEQTDLIEKRKEFWREDTKLGSLVSRAADERRSAENNLASMMDKVSIYFMLVCARLT